MPEPTRVVILAALESECRAIRRAVGKRDGIEVLAIGIRAVRMPAIAPDTWVIVAGLAGALDPSLKIGDLVLDSTCNVPSDWAPWRLGTIFSSDELVTTPEMKADLFCQTGASVVDMEHATVRQSLAKDARIIGLRAVSDTSDMSVNPAVLGMIDVMGRPRPLQVLTTLARSPGLIPELSKLNSNAKIALRNLGKGVAALLDQFP